MRLKTIAAFCFAAALSVGGAWVSAGLVETRSAEVVTSKLIDGEHDWTTVTTDGLLVALGGEAPDEATRFRVVSAVGAVVDPDRIVDNMDVKAREKIEAPRFSVEMLRNGEGISLIGLIPPTEEGDSIADQLRDLAEGSEITDLLETANYPVPANWEPALAYSIKALRDLERSKISVSADLIEITAISDSPDSKRRIESQLARSAPNGVRLALNISAPRPVITPFTLRFTLDAEGVAAFDACSADTEETKRRILLAASAAGRIEKPECAIGLGVPSPNWAKAVEVAIAGLKDVGGGSLTFSDADITMVALDTTGQGTFDRVVGEVDAALPEVFSLHAVLPEKVVVDGTGAEAAIEFVATRSPEGLVQLRGRLPDDNVEQIVGSFARAQFGSDKVYLATRDDSTLPESWPVRVLAALEALASLENGSAVVQKDYVEIRGVSGDQSASDTISRKLADKLGDSENFEVNVRYDEMLDTTLDLPTPEECVARINTILNSAKIVFEPSSSEITEAAGRTVDRIAEIAKQCERVRMEIGGYTDSQGREEMNTALSQQRADAVRAALLARRVLTSNISSKGYGETDPIADNDTADGREANRRIEFKLLTDARAAATDEPEGDTTEAETETPSE
ncbi:OmpA-OmpF porin, OOP family [Litoreibacter ascidiaceicola]|uniref:OmpA-OmpF porin, OOP family n=1 Tax=Litoreibacter ascidiaceicola TaxID=1486859 RepID=A0A1M5CA38_9RHOB|nr:OmpA family protein [Litoreibacter ascidiaceicola]SHF51623.1 OmpA-OmpF porin, OOP family [Litoreibacter ascidiaceicola]